MGAVFTSFAVITIQICIQRKRDGAYHDMILDGWSFEFSFTLDSRASVRECPMMVLSYDNSHYNSHPRPQAELVGQ